MTEDSICILGGTGFVGQHLAAKLNELNIPSKILTQNRDKHREILVLPLVETIEADVYDVDVLATHFAGCSAVINLVGILNESGHSGEGFRRAHVDLTRKIVTAAQQTRIKRILHMSALHADAASGKSYYLRTKGEAEDYVHTFSSEIPVTSFRPSVIFGPNDSFFNRFAKLLKITPFVFPLACANAKFAPVYVGDIVTEFVNALEDNTSFGKRIDLCGPKEYTLRELVEYTAKMLKLSRKVYNLPMLMAYAQACVMEYCIPGKPFSLDNYKSLQIDSICQGNGKNSHCRTLSTTIESVVPNYLTHKNQRAYYNQLRQTAHRDEQP